MNGRPLTELTTNLPAAARRGDRDAIGQWLSEWSRREEVEAIVIIDLRTDNVRAVTGWSATKAWLPEDLEERTKNEDERLELWHNHPRTPDAQTNSIPSVDDIIMAMRAGVAALGVVDNHADRQVIRRGAQSIDNPAAARRWLQQAQMITETAIGAAGGNVTKERAAIETATIVVAAAHAVGMVRWTHSDARTTERGQRVARATSMEAGTPAELAKRMVPKDEGRMGHSASSKPTEGRRRWKTQPSTERER